MGDRRNEKRWTSLFGISVVTALLSLFAAPAGAWVQSTAQISGAAVAPQIGTKPVGSGFSLVAA